MSLHVIPRIKMGIKLAELFIAHLAHAHPERRADPHARGWPFVLGARFRAHHEFAGRDARQFHADAVAQVDALANHSELVLPLARCAGIEWPVCQLDRLGCGRYRHGRRCGVACRRKEHVFRILLRTTGHARDLQTACVHAFRDGIHAMPRPVARGIQIDPGRQAIERLGIQSHAVVSFAQQLQQLAVAGIILGRRQYADIIFDAHPAHVAEERVVRRRVLRPTAVCLKHGRVQPLQARRVQRLSVVIGNGVERSQVRRRCAAAAVVTAHAIPVQHRLDFTREVEAARRSPPRLDLARAATAHAPIGWARPPRDSHGNRCRTPLHLASR